MGCLIYKGGTKGQENGYLEEGCHLGPTDETKLILQLDFFGCFPLLLSQVLAYAWQNLFDAAIKFEHLEVGRRFN